MKTVPLKAIRRTRLGKGQVKKIRAEKLIPAVVYGAGIEATPLEVNQDDFNKVIHTKAGENVIIRLEVSGGEAVVADGGEKLEKTVVIKDIQRHAVTDAIAHVDFNAISLTEKIKVNVPLHVTGESTGVKQQGGILDVIHHEIEVECLPTEIPDKLTAEISAMEIGMAIHIKELVFPKGVVPSLGPDEVVVTIHAPKAEAAPAEEAPAEPEVIGKKKEEGEEGAEPAGEKAAKQSSKTTSQTAAAPKEAKSAPKKEGA